MTMIKRMLTAVLLYATVIIAALAGLPGSATAKPAPVEPGPTGVPDPDSTPPIAWTQLGRTDRIDIVGSNQAFDTDIPVPQGVTPGQLQGSIGSVVNVVDGRVDVIDSRGVVIGSVQLPPDQVSAPFAVDISKALVTDGVAKLSFVVRDHNLPETSCSQPASLTLSQLTATYLGQTPFPAVAADFLPGYVDQFMIRTGPNLGLSWVGL